MAAADDNIPHWADGLLVPLAPAASPQLGPCRFPPALGHALPGALPYGWWTMHDGSHVLFDRSYSPLWARSPDGVVTACDRTQWTEWVRMEWFYDYATPPWRNKETRARCEEVLRRWALPVVEVQAKRRRK